MTSLELVLRQCGTLCGVLVLLCGLLIRSLIPIGYMPDPEAWRNGQVTMTFCTADGTTISLALEDLFDAPKHHPEQGGLATCPCCFIYHNYADHVMDNFSLRDFTPAGGMAMPMVSNVDRATWGGRIAGQWNVAADLTMDAGVDYQNSRHRLRRSMGSMPYKSNPRIKDAHFTNAGVFTELTWDQSNHQRWITGARIDRATAKDFRATTGMGNMVRANPTQGLKRTETLPSGFVRYEHDLQHTKLYAGLGHVQRMPDYWELISPNMGQWAV